MTGVLKAMGAGPARRLALRLLVASALVGGVVTFLAGRAAGGQCGAIEVDNIRVAADPVCDQLVRTLSARVGLASALATVVIVLTMAGLRRTATARSTWGGPPPEA